MTHQTVDTRTQVLDELRDGERFMLVTHENPDGDAIGSLVGMHGVLRLLGKDSVMYMPPDELPLPYEYRSIDLGDAVTEFPPDVAERTLVFLDCGNIDRNAAAGAFGADAHIVNLDHHHDNTLFGTVNHVVEEASCTAEIVWDLMGALGVTPTSDIARALYVGLVTDTGRFMYENTGARAHIMAADLIAAGIDVHLLYRQLYEDVPPGKIRLLARALDAVQHLDGGALTYSHLSAEDFRRAGAQESYSEGIIDHLRAVQGTQVAALARQLLDDPARHKVSLRSTDGVVDVSVIARAGGGGGHKRAAGFTTELSQDELLAFLREQVAAQA